MAARAEEGRRIRRSQLIETEEVYVRKLERMGLIPSGFRRYPDGSLTFGARPRGRKNSAKHLRSVAQ
jgi:hypothetical protein